MALFLVAFVSSAIFFGPVLTRQISIKAIQDLPMTAILVHQVAIIISLYLDYSPPVDNS